MKFKEQLEESLLFVKLKKEGKSFKQIGEMNPNPKTGKPQHSGHVGRVIHFGLLMGFSEETQQLFLSEKMSQKWWFIIQRLHKDLSVQHQIAKELIGQMDEKKRKKVTELEFQELGYQE
jgi:hypothetical protein